MSSQPPERKPGLLIVGADFKRARGEASLSDTAYRRAFFAAAPSSRKPAKPEPSGAVLDAKEFNAFVMRERDLADRGTRVFSLIMVRKHRDADMRRVALKVRDRVRSTDLVGMLEQERIGVLLTDTDPVGAKVVCDWIGRAADELGMPVDATIYVYPTVTEGRDRDGTSQGDHSTAGHSGNGRNGHSGNGRSGNGHAGNGNLLSRLGDRATDGRGANGAADSAFDVRPDGRRSKQREWPVADLWPELTQKTPPWKRALDVAGATVALTALAPLFAALALAVKLDSPGPVIFRQQRAGRGGKPFTFYKFRSMCVDAEKRRAELAALNEQTGPVFKMRADPRVTRVGRILRRWSLDELPQLWNVLKGDISFVGPRSPTFDEVVQYERWHRRRLNITGGITCFWQVSGRSKIGFREWMRMDRWYVQRHCLALDVWLLLRTLPAVVSGRGAC